MGGAYSLEEVNKMSETEILKIKEKDKSWKSDDVKDRYFQRLREIEETKNA